MRQTAIALALAAGTALAAGSAHANLTFTTFVSGSDILAAEGNNNNTIAFNYAGDKFIGSVYIGTDPLYQTDLNGNNVQLYGQGIPGSGEVVVGAGLGKGGFASGTIYAGSQADGTIYKVPSSGAPTVFATVPTGQVRQIFFDPGSSFGGNMLVTTTVGDIYEVTSGGSVSLLASVGEDTEGMDIAPSGWGTLAGQLLVSSEGDGAIRAIDALGNVTPVAAGIPQAETVSAVPSNFSAGGSPTEGFYVANYPNDIQFADWSQFVPYEGDVIVTSEDSSNARVWLLTYSGGTVSVSGSPIGNLPGQSEDGIFVSGQRIADATTPEPAGLAVLGVALAGLVGARMRRRR